MKKIIALVLAMVMLFASATVMNVFAAGEPAFVVSNVSGKAGDTVSVTISLENNPGVIHFKLYTGYDASVMELVKAEKSSEFSDMSFSKYITDNPYNLLWDDALNPDNTTNGVIVTFTFKIKETAVAGTYPITVTYPVGDVFNSDYVDVDFATVNGSVTVEAVEEEGGIDYEEAATSGGANIRIQSGEIPAGLRFATTVNKADLGIEGDYEYSEDADIIFGTFMIPKRILDKTEYDTLQALVESGNTTDVLNVVAKRVYAQDDETLTYTAVLTNIPDKGLVTEIVALPYVLVDGTYYFAEQSSNSYYNVATSARETTYSNSAIAAITDPDEKAAAQAVADALDKVITKVENEGWIDNGWY